MPAIPSALLKSDSDHGVCIYTCDADYSPHSVDSVDLSLWTELFQVCREFLERRELMGKPNIPFPLP